MSSDVTLNTIFYCSVMEKLPATSYVRLVDIWLISIQLVPFLLVTMTTASELFMDEKPDESYTNHHGMARLI